MIALRTSIVLLNVAYAVQAREIIRFINFHFQSGPGHHLFFPLFPYNLTRNPNKAVFPSENGLFSFIFQLLSTATNSYQLRKNATYSRTTSSTTKKFGVPILGPRFSVQFQKYHHALTNDRWPFRPFQHVQGGALG